MSTEVKDRSTLTVRVDEALLQRFKLIAVRRRKSMSTIMREFIEWYVEKEEKA